MNAATLDALARDVDGLRNRRTTLGAIGLGALAAVATRPSLIEARKERKKTRKRIDRKCKRQIDACRASLTALCAAADCEADSLANLLSCCPLLADCKAGASLDCFFSTLN